MITETMNQKQSRFTFMLADFLIWLKAKGYLVAFGEAQRSDEQAEINALGEEGREQVAALIAEKFPALAAKLRNNGKANGIRMTLHELSLAVDLRLFLDGVYLTETEQYREAGEEWERRGGSWGGRFKDGNHFSLEHGGKK